MTDTHDDLNDDEFDDENREKKATARSEILSSMSEMPCLLPQHWTPASDSQVLTDTCTVLVKKIPPSRFF